MPLLFGKEIKISYVIATIPRTGSHLLCEALAATNIAGTPREPFAKMNFPILIKEWSLSKDVPYIDYIAAAVAHDTTPNGVFGVKVQWDQIERVRKLLDIGKPKDSRIVDRLFPNAKYIYLKRKDIRGLAISYYRANATNEWWRKKDVFNHQTNAPDPLYDSDSIRELENHFSQMQNTWVRYFQARSIVPLVVEYADLEKDWCHEANRCLTFLGLDPIAKDVNYQPTFIRQADAKTRMWRKRLDDEDINAEENG